ncbi:MAG TPA: hypothetical protein VE462_01210 [Propionibacteriaceae bacterium]|jgi:hypothetical protein|nr:hypothetical protein [Propionibacteriaceae bacterium]
MTSKQFITDAELHQHLRRTLHAVAATIAEPPSTATSAAPHRRGRRILLGLGAIAVAAPLAAGGLFGLGPEYVDELPPGNVITTGILDGERYWMVESFHRDSCGQLMPGVELVVEERNIIGQEWSTTGYSYGEPIEVARNGLEVRVCGYDTTQALADPAVSFSSGAQVGDAMIWIYAVHPDVTALRVTIDGAAQAVPVHPVDAAGYALIELPESTKSYIVDLLINDDVVPGSRKTRDLHR